MACSDNSWVIAVSGTSVISLVRSLEVYGIPYQIQHEGKIIHVLVPEKYLSKVVDIQQIWDHGADED